MGGKMAGRTLVVVAGALGVLVATAGVVALARALTDVPGDGGIPPCAVSVTGAPASDVAGPAASAAGEEYWTPERMRDAQGAGQGENGDQTPAPTPTCR